MRKLFFGVVVAAIITSLAGCIAGSDEPYDDSKSVYEPTITLNEAIANDSDYELTLVKIERKAHPDVGDIVEIYFDYNNKTDQDLYITSDFAKFDDKEISESVMAFFNDMPANSQGTTSAIFQEIKEHNWTVEPLIKSLKMNVQIVDQEPNVIATYPLTVSF